MKFSFFGTVVDESSRLLVLMLRVGFWMESPHLVISWFLWELYLQLKTPTLVPFPFMMYRLLCANLRLNEKIKDTTRSCPGSRPEMVS